MGATASLHPDLIESTVATGRSGPSEPASAAAFRPLALRRTGWVRYNFGLQAFIDNAMSRRTIVERGSLLVPHKFLPMLRLLVDDPAEIERGYEAVRLRRERIHLWDSPRERWRKNYGNFVREIEWVLLEPTDQGGPGKLRALFERVFSGGEGLEMSFDPHLPETSCAIRVRI